MNGYIRKFQGGGKAKVDLGRRILETLSNKRVVEDVFPEKEHGVSLSALRNATKNTGNEYMLMKDDAGKTSFFTSHNPNFVKIPEELIEKLMGGASIHTHPQGSPYPSTGDMNVWGAPQGGWGVHDLLVFGMPEGHLDMSMNAPTMGARNAPPNIYGATRVKASKSVDPAKTRGDYESDMYKASGIWNDPDRMRTLMRDYGSVSAPDLVKILPALRMIEREPDLVSGYWADNARGVTVPSLIDMYLNGKGKYWKRGGFIRQARATVTGKDRH